MDSGAGTGRTGTGAVGHDERLRVPRWGVPVAAALGGLGFAYPAAQVPRALVAVVIALGVVAGAAAAVVAGRARVLVADGVLSAGRVQVPLARVTGVEEVSDVRMALRPGRPAQVRGWVPTAVVVHRDDGPPCVLSTRSPGRLAAALRGT